MRAGELLTAVSVLETSETHTRVTTVVVRVDTLDTQGQRAVVGAHPLRFRRRDHVGVFTISLTGLLTMLVRGDAHTGEAFD